MFCMQMKPTGKTDQRSREDYLEWRSVFVVVCGGLRWRWLGSLVAAATMLLLFPCKDTSPYVFSFSFFLFFFSVFTLSVLSSIFVLLLSSFFFFSPVFSFFHSLFSLSSFFLLLLLLLSSSSALSSPVFIGKKHRERGLLPLSSHGTGVEWTGQPLCSRPRTAWGARPFCFSPRGRPWVRA